MSDKVRAPRIPRLYVWWGVALDPDGRAIEPDADFSSPRMLGGVCVAYGIWQARDYAHRCVKETYGAECDSRANATELKLDTPLPKVRVANQHTLLSLVNGRKPQDQEQAGPGDKCPRCGSGFMVTAFPTSELFCPACGWEPRSQPGRPA